MLEWKVIVGRNIRCLREERCLTQEQLAFEAQIDLTYLGGNRERQAQSQPIGHGSHCTGARRRARRAVGAFAKDLAEPLTIANIDLRYLRPIWNDCTEGEEIGMSEGSMSKADVDLSPAALRSARNLLKLSREELASKAGISVSTLGRLERGEPTTSEYPRKRVEQAFRKEGLIVLGSGQAKA